MRMRQSLTDLERALAYEMEHDRHRRERAQRQADVRARQRQVAKVHKRGSIRFALLVSTLILTAVIVTVAMFKVLYVVLG